MKPFPKRLAVGLLSMVPAGWLFADEPIPVEDFARAPLAAEMRMSPDGQSVAFLRTSDGLPVLFAGSAEAAQFVPVGLGQGGSAPEPGQALHLLGWISNSRLVTSTGGGLAAVNHDGTQYRAFAGSRILFSFSDPGQSVLVSDRSAHPDVWRTNTIDGSTRLAVKNPGNVMSWEVDHKGRVRLGVTSDGPDDAGLTYRETEEAPWRPLALIPHLGGELVPLGFDGSNELIYLAARSPSRRTAIYLVNPKTGELGEPVAEHPEYDVYSRELALEGPGELIFAGASPKLVGVSYVDEAPRTDWRDPVFFAYQHTLDKVFPQTLNRVMSLSGDAQRLLVLASSDRDPGTYYLFDPAGKFIKKVASRMDWIKSSQMAAMYPINYKARDGWAIHGYLTLPSGKGQKQLPLVVIPHDGPDVRDIWGFDPLVQMLANHGYAVLQMNYRGSAGYGDEFERAGSGEIGGKIQDDIEDGVRWALTRGIADPKRIAIAGTGYGGYCALFALAHSPDLYSCGISIAGITNWEEIARGLGLADMSGQYQKKLPPSPVGFADKISSPVLVIQGSDDPVVPAEQAHELVLALEKAGHAPESLFIPDQGHVILGDAARTQEFKRIDEFLKKNLGARTTAALSGGIPGTLALSAP